MLSIDVKKLDITYIARLASYYCQTKAASEFSMIDLGLTTYSCDDLTFACAFVMDCDAKPRYLGDRRLSLSWTRQELCDTTDHIKQGLLLARSDYCMPHDCNPFQSLPAAKQCLHTDCNCYVVAFQHYISVLRNTCTSKAQETSKWTKVTRPSLAVGEGVWSGDETRPGTLSCSLRKGPAGPQIRACSISSLSCLSIMSRNTTGLVGYPA